MRDRADHPIDRLPGHAVYRDVGRGAERQRTAQRRRLAPRLQPHLQHPGRIPFHQRADRMHPEDQLGLGHASSVAPQPFYRRLEPRPRRPYRTELEAFR